MCSSVYHVHWYVHHFLIYLARAQDLAQKFAVRAMPTFMAFYKGEKIGDCVGADLSKIGKLIEECVLTSVPNAPGSNPATSQIRHQRVSSDALKYSSLEGLQNCHKDSLSETWQHIARNSVPFVSSMFNHI